MTYQYTYNLISEGSNGGYLYALIHGKRGLAWLYLYEFPEPAIRIWN